MKINDIKTEGFKLPESIELTTAFAAMFRSELDAEDTTLFEWNNEKLSQTVDHVLDKLGINYPEDAGDWKAELISIALDEFECTAGYALGTYESDEAKDYKLPKSVLKTNAFTKAIFAIFENDRDGHPQYTAETISSTVDEALDELGIEHPDNNGAWKLPLIVIANEQFELSSGYPLGQYEQYR